MFSILKFVIFLAGCAVIYGIVTGQDLNVLFSTLISEIKPVLSELIKVIYDFIKNAISSN